MMGLLTGHSYLKGHLFKQGLTNTPECDKARMHLKQPTLFVVGVLVTLRFRQLCHHFMMPGEFVDIHQQDTAL
jgi:hypothetical protein